MGNIILNSYIQNGEYHIKFLYRKTENVILNSYIEK